MGKFKDSPFWKKIDDKGKIEQGPQEPPNKKRRLYHYTGKTKDTRIGAIADLDKVLHTYALGDKNYRKIEGDVTVETLEESPFLLREGNKFKLLNTKEFFNHLREHKNNSPPLQSVDLPPRSQTSIDLKLMKAIPRLAHVDTLNDRKPNNKLTEDEFKTLTASEGLLELSSENPFKPKLVKGQIKWESDNDVYAEDVSEVIRKTSLCNRSIHINTGTHGNAQGKTVLQDISLADVRFIEDDINLAWNLNNVSVHTVTQNSPPFTSDEYPNLDIIDAWCYSEKSKHTLPAKEDAITNVIHRIVSSLASAQEKAQQSEVKVQGSPFPQAPSVSSSSHSGPALSSSSHSGSAFSVQGDSVGNFGNSTQYHAPTLYQQASPTDVKSTSPNDATSTEHRKVTPEKKK